MGERDRSGQAWIWAEDKVAEIVMNFVVFPASRLRSPFVAAALALTVLWSAGGAQAETSIKFVLGAKVDAAAAPLLVALDKGYFKAEGLNVSIVEPVLPEPNEQANQVARRIAAGDAEMGFGDINTLIRLRAAPEPVPVKAIYIVYNKPAYAVIGRKSRGIQQPFDLFGKKVGAPTRDPTTAQWKIFAKANGLDPTKVKIEHIGMPVREPMLAAGQVDAILAISYYAYLDLKDRGVPTADLTMMLMADHGVKLYGNAIMVSQKFAEANRDAVQGFLRAYNKALKETIAKPANAIGLIVRRSETLHKELELERLKMIIGDNIQTPEIKSHGYGAIDPQRFGEAIDQIAGSDELKQKPKVDEVFDDTFLPPEAQRKL